MYKKELDNKLRSGNVPRAMVLLGDNNFFIDYYGNKVTKHFAKDSDINRFYYDEFELDVAIRTLSQPSLFGGENVVVIKHSKMKKSELTKLLETVEKYSYAFLIVELYELDSRKLKDMMSSVKFKTSEVVRFFSPNNIGEIKSEYLPILREEATKFNIHIDNDNFLYLLDIHSNSIELAISDIGKLSLLDKENISKEDINLMCLGSSKVDVDELIYSILSNNIDINREIKNLLDDGVEPYAVMIRFESIINELLLIHLYIKSTGSSSLREIIGYEPPKHIAQKRIDVALSLKEAQYENILKEIFTSECEIMRPNIEKESILISFLIKIQALIRNN